MEYFFFKLRLRRFRPNRPGKLQNYGGRARYVNPLRQLYRYVVRVGSTGRSVTHRTTRSQRKFTRHRNVSPASSGELRNGVTVGRRECKSVLRYDNRRPPARNANLRDAHRSVSPASSGELRNGVRLMERIGVPRARAPSP